MTNRADVRLQLLDGRNFRELFIEELGWEKPRVKPVPVEVDAATYELRPVAEYRGVRVWEHPAIPDSRVQRALDAEIRRHSAERLIIFHDGARQQWKWPVSSDVAGRGTARLVTHEHFRGSRTEALLQRLLEIEIGAEEEPSVVELVLRLRRAFDAEKVTASFYAKFSAHAAGLSAAIRGIATKSERDWYAALLLNRLMFIYFLQKKGFLDGRINFLADCLREVQALNGTDKFYEFYSDFLLPLFHDGLGSSDRPLVQSPIAKIIGDVPYVNGGIFSVHALEASNAISIPDAVFDEVFEFFNSYQWHLDDRQTGNPTEINPDVLGYIFEQFINNKEQGAYYTKDDVTAFMTRSALIPAFFDRAQTTMACGPWELLAESPERYVWAGLAFGAENGIPDRVMIEAGSWPRPSWSALAGSSLGLPGETWWEVQERRGHLDRVMEALRKGQIGTPDQAIECNLDLESLAVDFIDSLESPDDVAACWAALTSLKIVDPTCGSGAFLFAALRQLEQLYSAVLDAAEEHLKRVEHKELRELLENVADHPSRSYFILKHATLRNLYGVDLMHEAVEIARLRLFLKLVAAVESRSALEPLPDLEFNIKAGNALVGAYNSDAIARESDDLLSEQTAGMVAAAAARIASEYSAFQRASESNAIGSSLELRRRLRAALNEIRAVADDQYHAMSGGTQRTLKKWQQTHQPFHWFIEFPDVFSQGGFDVVIGNPPYVGRTRLRDYSFSGFATDDLPDIYAPCVERATQISNATGRFAMILPISAQFAGSFGPLREVLGAAYPRLWVSAFSRNPAALFSAGLGVRSTIVIGSRQGEPRISVTKTHRWYDEYRPTLFEALAYEPLPDELLELGWLRPTSAGLCDIFKRLLSVPGNIGSATRARGSASVGFKQTCLYWLSVFVDDPPCFELDGTTSEQTKIGRLSFDSPGQAKLALAILASKLAFVWWYCTGDDFDVTQDGLRSTPVDPARLSPEAQKALIQAADEILESLPEHVMFTKYAGKWMGNFVLSEMRNVTDKVDQVLATEFGYTRLLPALEHAYACAYKPTGDRPGTLRQSPFTEQGAPTGRRG